MSVGKEAVSWNGVFAGELSTPETKHSASGTMSSMVILPNVKDEPRPELARLLRKQEA